MIKNTSFKEGIGIAGMSAYGLWRLHPYISRDPCPHIPHPYGGYKSPPLLLKYLIIGSHGIYFILAKNWRSAPSFDSSCGGLARFARKIVCFLKKLLASLACLIHNLNFWHHQIQQETWNHLQNPKWPSEGPKMADGVWKGV